MELKSFQKKIVEDLGLYLDYLNENRNLEFAWSAFHTDNGNNFEIYQNTIEGVPHVCIKVPTGGGKTFIATSSIKTIFDGIYQQRARFVIWLVPSDSILEQTIRNLSNPNHPYREKLERDFPNGVQILTKDEMLLGQNFSPSTVDSKILTIGIFSYSSIRIDSRKKDARKVFQSNGNLQTFDEFGEENFLENTPESALIQVIRRFSPVVIVDESHNATSTLSVEMLENLNPSFILDLTATPRKNSNILSIADSQDLRDEGMVKIPVIVYNQTSTDNVIEFAIKQQKHLEKLARKESSYIRPIVLFQAQPDLKSKESETFEKIRDDLINLKIPREQIAIKTSNINELSGIDLLSKDCPIRFIITVNALKEGWDCPFAYILASLANRSSEVDVEQIVGRILRQPYITRCKNKDLNQSYIFTSSDDFHATIIKIIGGLNGAGFSERDCRAFDQSQIQSQIQSPTEIQNENQTKDRVENQIENQTKERIENQTEVRAEEQIEDPIQIENRVENQIENQSEIVEYQIPNEDKFESRIEVKQSSQIRPEFREEIQQLQLPQFTIKTETTLFNEKFLEPEDLLDGFSLKDADIEVDYEANVVEIDIDKNRKVTFRTLNWFEKKSFVDPIKNFDENARRMLLDEVMMKLDGDNSIKTSEIQAYVERVILNMDEDRIKKVLPWIFASSIKKKIDSMKEKHREQQFYKLVGIQEISCHELFKFPMQLELSTTESIPRSLYESELGDLNNFERDILLELIKIPTVRWWHRNISKRGFCLNGFKNHYPDFIVRLESGKTILLETKGEHLDGTDSQQKLKIGQEWQDLSGEDFKYFMVFDSNANKFLNQVRFM